MSEEIFCSTCSHKNPSETSVCEICGVATDYLPKWKIKKMKAEGKPIPEQRDLEGPRRGRDRVLLRQGAVQSLHAHQVATETNLKYKQMVYCPAGASLAADKEIFHAAGKLALASRNHSTTGKLDGFEEIPDIFKSGSRVLDGLRNGGRLYIVGHGNSGSGIGSHDAHFGAKTLVKMLGEDKLPQRPAGRVIVYLYACCTGVSVKAISYAFWHKEPYVLRFARALAAAGFSNFYTVGFAGFVSPDGDICKNYYWSSSAADQRKWETIKNIEHVVYRVDDGKAVKVKGDEWTQSTNYQRGKGFVLNVARK